METVLCGVGDIFHCVGLNNNRFIDSLKRYIFGVPLYFGEDCGFYTGCDLNYLSNIHLLKAAIIF